MSAPPSQAKPPGDDFVLWPERLGQGAGRVSEAAIRRTLADLAPAEWVAEPDSEPVSSTEPELREPAAKEERFYPASRQWFRTTAAIPSTDASEKWWQEPPAPPVLPAAEPPPSVADSTPSIPASASGLLSPEEIWELAAEELSQVSRLGARPASHIPPAGGAVAPPSVPGPVEKPVDALHPLSSTPPLTESAAEDPPAAPLAPASLPPEAPGVAETAGLGDLAAVPPPAPPVTPAEAYADGDIEQVLWREQLSPLATTVKALSDEWNDPPPRSERNPVLSSAPSAPVIAFPSAATRSVPDAPPVPGDAPPTREGSAAVLEPSKSVDVPGPMAPRPVGGLPPAEPLAAVPVSSRSPLSLRSEPQTSTLPTQRRGTLKDRPDPLPGPEWDIARGKIAGEEPRVVPPGVTVLGVDPAAAEPETGLKERRRRPRSERRRVSDSGGSGVRWGRWVTGVFGLVVVVAGVTAMVARDHLPPEWERTATLWWRKAHQMVFPHQYGYPRRGVVPRAGQASPATSGPDPAAQAGAGSAAATPVAAVAAGAEPQAPPENPGPPADPAGGRPALGSIPGLSTTAPAPASKPAAVAPSTAPDGIPVRRAEPVEDETTEPQPGPPTAPEVGPAASATEPAASADEVVAAEAASPASRVVSGTAAAERTDSDGGSFTLWDGDEGEDETSEGGKPAPSASSEPASAEVIDAQKAVRSLVSARSVNEVLPWIFDAATLDSTVRAYYTEHPLQALTDAVIEHEYSGVIPATGGKAHIFKVLDAAHPRGFPVSAESTPQGYRIDWQSYIQWRDGWLRRFLLSKSFEPQTLFVVLRRTHYFNDDVPKLDDKLAFKITSAVLGDEGAVAFVEKNSAVGRSLAELYEWRTMYFPVVELQWMPVGKEGRYLRLNRIVRPTWRRIGE